MRITINDLEQANGQVLNIVQNAHAFSLLDDIVQQNEIPCTFEAAGELMGGRRVWAMVKMPYIEILGDIVDQYLYLFNSHDGTSSFQAGLSHIRIACTNAMKMMFSTASAKWVARHTVSVQSRREEAIRVLGLTQKHQKRMIAEANHMAEQKVNIENFAKLLFPSKEGTVSKRSINTVDEMRFRLITLHNEKDDLANFRGTAYGAYSAVSDLISNTKPMRVTDNSADRKLAGFFDGYPLLNKAQQILAAVA
jgi:phage/plasmid-like protein (TIGR03299 family)